MPKILSNQVISNVNNLCRTLGMSRKEIESLVNMSDDELYFKPKVKAFKKDGSERLIRCPNQQLRVVQGKINNRIFKELIDWPEFIYGSVPNPDDLSADAFLEGKDYVSCAYKHCGSKSILKIDIEDFFSNVHEYHVKQLFEKLFKYDSEVASYLTRLCCYKSSLVQGALTSSYIASLIFWDVERNVVARLARKNLVYTRLVDDITISSKISKYNFSHADRIVSDMLLIKDLPINDKKKKTLYSSTDPLTVHGLRVSFKSPRLPSDEIRRIRASLQALEKLSSEPAYRTSFGYRKDYFRCLGRVNKLARVKHEKHRLMMNRLKKIIPLPSEIDIKIARLVIVKLDAASKIPNKLNSYWYRRQYWKLVDRINLISRTFIVESSKLKADLNNLPKPK